VSKLSQHFSRSEFACKCGCGFNTVDCELLTLAEVARDFIGAFTPNSACRCPAHNSAVGGGKNSQHLIGRAMDVPTDDPKALHHHLDKLYPDTLGLGLYSWGVHVDSRLEKVRW